MTDDKDGSATAPKTNIDPSSPYYVHPSDSPRQMQTNECLFDVNYSDWSQEMANFLFAKNKMWFVDRSIPKPTETDEMYAAWMRCDAMIKCWLITAMEKDIRASVKYAKTAKETWNDLKEMFEKENAPRAYELKQTLTLTRQEGASISTYYTKLRDYSTIRTQLLAMKPPPTLREVYRLVSEDEQQRSVAAGMKPARESVAFLSSYGRDTKQQQQRNKSANSKETCTHCGKTGHDKGGCFELNRCQHLLLSIFVPRSSIECLLLLKILSFL
ncbi:uncharacterized protein LOC110918893 [Helianthus annuus]|uniref:uncharacterized protein LOC110918893 n=1 Tax=Helianthus annuus TaxID=4232 RepID=UPI000B906DE9|nr:uncharacterized protein LOC110918893 [Helianthus annuus]